MLRSVIISPDKRVATELQSNIAEIPSVGLLRVFDHYPNSIELARFVRAHAPEVIFLSVSNLEQAGQTMQHLEAAAPGTQVIAIHSHCDSQLLMQILRLGIRDFLSSPFERPTTVGALARAAEALERNPIQHETSDLLYSFLPSKAGVGTSTIAMNTAFAVSHADPGNTLLTDLDLSSGMIRFMLKLQNNHSVCDAADHAAEMDENLWPQLVTSFGRLDVLHAGKLNPSHRIDPVQVRQLVAFMRRNYKVVMADLSGNLEKYSIDIMHESKKIFLVCTPEIPSLHLAREKFQFLKSLDLGGRVSVLLNRYNKRCSIGPAQVEELLGVPVEVEFANDYQGVTNAMAAGKPVEASSEFGRKCADLARLMLEKKQVTAAEPKKRFIEFFTINSNPRYGFEAKKGA